MNTKKGFVEVYFFLIDGAGRGDFFHITERK